MILTAQDEKRSIFKSVRKGKFSSLFWIREQLSLSSQILHLIYKTIHEFSQPLGIRFHAFPVRGNANQYYTSVMCVLKDGNGSFAILITRFFFQPCNSNGRVL